MEREFFGDMGVEHVNGGHVDAIAPHVAMNREREQPLAHPERQSSNHIRQRAYGMNGRKITAIQGALEQLDEVGVQLVDGLRQRNAAIYRCK